MGGKARWRKLQRVVGCMPQGPHASVDKPRQRRERARTRDAKRRRLGNDGEEEADTILIGAKKEINKEEKEQRSCEEKNEDDKGTEKPHQQQEDKVKTQLNDDDDYDINSYNDKKIQEAVEQRAGVWTASPNGWLFRPLSDTTLEEELRKAQEEEEENGRKDRVQENGQRLAKFFLSDDESDSDTAIFIDAYQPVLTENNELGSPATPVPASQSQCETSLDGLLENSSGFPVQSRVQVPLEAEDVELVMTDSIEEDEISETLDPLARISTMEAVMTDSPHHDSQRSDPPSNILDPGTAPDPVSTDPCIESAESLTNRQPSCKIMTDVSMSNDRSAKDRTDCRNGGSEDDRFVESTMAMKTVRQTDTTQDILHLELDTESHSMPDTSTPRGQITSTMNTEVSSENCPRPELDCYDNLGQENQDVHATIYRGDSEAENLFFSMYPKYHPGELEESESQEPENGVTTSSKDKYLCSPSSCEAPQDSGENMAAASQEVDVQDKARQLEDFQEVCDGSQTTNLAPDVSSEASLTAILDRAATSTPDINSTTLHESLSLHHEMHQLESSTDQLGEVEETRTEAGQDALEMERRLEIESGSQTLVGKAREWIKGVARMGYAKPTEGTSSFETVKTEGDAEVLTALTDTGDAASAEEQAGLTSDGGVKLHFTPEGDQDACFTSAEGVKDLNDEQTPQSDVSLHSSLKWDSYSCFQPDEDVPENTTPVQDPKEDTGSSKDTKTLPELTQDPEVHDGDEPTQDSVQDSQSSNNHYLPDENMHYFTPANDARDYFTPGKTTDQPIPTSALQACYPLPDPTPQHTYPQMLIYSKPATQATHHNSSELHYTPEEEMCTPYTPVEEIKVIHSSVELLQPHYTPVKDSTIHATFSQKLETQVKEIFQTPDTKDLKQYYTPAQHSNRHTPAEEHRIYLYGGKDHSTSTPGEEENYHYTPTKGSNTYKSAEEQEADYIPEEEEEEEEQMTYYSTEDHEGPCISAKEQRTLGTPEKDGLVEPHTPEEGEKVHHTSEEQHKGYHTPVGEHWPHYTPTDKQNNFFISTEEINGFSTPAEEGDTSYTPEDNQSTHHTPVQKTTAHYTSEDNTSTCDEKQETHNTPDTTPADGWGHDYIPVAETNIISEPADENPIHYTPESKLTIPTEAVNINTHDNDLESHYIPDSHLETHDTPAREEEEGDKEKDEGEEKAEKREEDGGDNRDDEERKNDYIIGDIYEMKRVESEREERKDSEIECIDSGGEERKDSERERKDSEREERKDSEKDIKDSEREERINSERGRKDSEREKRNSEMERKKDNEEIEDSAREKKDSERERENSERERKDSESARDRRDSETQGRKDNEGEETKDSDREREDSKRERKDNEKEREERKDSERKDNEKERSKDSERDGKDSEREERKDSDKERKDSENEGSKDNEGEGKDSESEREDSESEGKDSEGESKDSERQGKESEREGRKYSEEKKDSEKEISKDSEMEGKDSESERKDNKGEERKDSEKEDSKDSEMEGKDNESERKDNEGEERKDSEKEGRKDSEKVGRDSEREREDSESEGKENERDERKDSEKEGCEREGKDSEKEGRKDGEKEKPDSDGERKDGDRETIDSEKERIENDREWNDSEKEMKYNERERKYSDIEREASERERKDSERERKDSEKDERRSSVSNEEGQDTTEERRPSEWEWRRNNGEESKRNSDWKRRKSEGNVNDDEMEGKKESTKEQTPAQEASATLDLGHCQAGGALAAATLDSHAINKTAGVSGATAPCSPSEMVTREDTTSHTEDTGVLPQHEMRGGRGESTRDGKPHQRHGKARHHRTSTGDGKSASETEYPENGKKEEKGGSKRRRNRRSKGRSQGEHETSHPQSQSATGSDRTASRTAEPRSHFSQRSSWEMEVSHGREIHYRSKEYPSQRQQESCSSRETLESSGTSGVFQKPTIAHQDDIVATPGSCKKSNKNVPHQNKQHQVEHKHNSRDGHTRNGRRRVERFSEEQKDAGTGGFAVAGSLGTAGSKGAQDGERRRGKGYEKGPRRSEYGEEMLQEKVVQGGGESSGRPAVSSVRSPRNERKDRKENRKERKERKFPDKPGEEFKKSELRSSREELSGAAAERGGGGALKSRPPLLATPVEGLATSAAQKREMKPAAHMTSGSLLGPPPSTLPSRTQAKLRYPEALLQPLSPPPSPPLHKAREVKEKAKPASGEMEKIKEAALPSDSPSYGKKASSQSVMYTIPEAAPATPQQAEQSTLHSHDRNLLHGQPSCPLKQLQKDTVEQHPSNSPKTSQPVSLHGKQTHISSNNSPPPASHDSLQSATQPSGLTASSPSDSQPLSKQLTSPSQSATLLLPSPLPSQQESLGVSTITSVLKPLLKQKLNLTEFDVLHNATSSEKENVSSEDAKTEDEEAKPLGSPERDSEAQRIKLPELSQNTTESKTDMSKEGDVSQARSTPAAKLPVASEDGNVAVSSLRHTSPSVRTIPAPKAPSKLLKETEVSPRTPSLQMASSSSSCTKRTETAALQTYDKPLQNRVSSPRLRRSESHKTTPPESVRESKSDERVESPRERGFSELQSSSQAQRNWTASSASALQQPHQELHLSSQEGYISPREGSMPRSRDARLMKKKRRR